MKKRVLSMAMATVMAASLTACGSGSTATTAAPTETNADTSAAASEAASEAAGSSDADVQKIIDRGVLKVGCKSEVLKMIWHMKSPVRSLAAPLMKQRKRNW